MKIYLCRVNWLKSRVNWVPNIYSELWPRWGDGNHRRLAICLSSSWLNGWD